jgi:hypothetical protein
MLALKLRALFVSYLPSRRTSAVTLPPRTALAAWDLINGRLLRPFSLSLRLSKTYWIVCPQATSTLPKIKACRDWLLAEAADDTRRLNEIRFFAERGGQAQPSDDCCAMTNGAGGSSIVLQERSSH